MSNVVHARFGDAPPPPPPRPPVVEGLPYFDSGDAFGTLLHPCSCPGHEIRMDVAECGGHLVWREWHHMRCGIWEVVGAPDGIGPVPTDGEVTA